MHFYASAALFAFATYVVYAIVHHFVEERRHAANMKAMGAAEPRMAKSDWFFGVSKVMEAIRHDRQGTFLDFIREKYMVDMGDRSHGMRILGNTGLATNEPKNVQALLATQFNDFGLGPARRDNFFPLLGNGIFTNDGKAWEHSRGLLRPQFTRDQVSDIDLEEDHVKNLMRALPADQYSGWTDETNLQVLFFRLTLDSATEFLLGESVDSQIINLPENIGKQNATSDGVRNEKQFAKAFDSAQGWLATRSRTMGMHWIIDSFEFRRSNRIVHNFIDYFVKRALEKNITAEKLASADEKKERYVFLDALTLSTRDPIELRSQLLNILLAGRDTTASLLGYTFYMLARHPDVFAKLRQTILTDFGPYSDRSRISFTTLKSCTYLQHIINEVLRLLPVVPLNMRQAMRDTCLPVGGGPDGKQKLYVRKGQQVSYSVYTMHRRPALWGDDADEFKPERWIGRKPGWEYLPFNGGPRICLGQQFALTEASYVIVRLLQRFDKIENLDHEPLTHFNTLTACPKNGVKVRLHEAAEA